MLQRPSQRRHIDVHQPSLAMRGMALRLEEIGGEHRRHEPGNGKAHQHRGDDGHAEILEELARYARHQADRQEHRDDRHRRRQHGQADLVGGVDRGLIGGFAHPHVAHDILDLDDRVIDQHARHQAEREQRHLVEVEPHQLHEPEGRDRRQRDGERGDDGRPPIAQEQEDDEHRQHGALDHRLDRAVILLLGVFDLVEDQLEMDLRIAFLERGELLFGLMEHRDVGRALRTLEIETEHLTAVEFGRAALLGVQVADLGDVGESDDTSAADRNLGLAEIIGAPGIAEHADRLFGTRDLGTAAGGVQIDLAELLIDLARGKALRLELHRIEDDADLAVDAAIATDRRHAGNRQQLLRHIIVDIPAELFDRHVGAHRGVAGEIVRLTC